MRFFINTSFQRGVPQ